MKTRRRHRLLRIVLVVAGIMMLPAFAAMLAPRAWIVDMHHWLGLGQFPDQPVAEYLARTTSGLYGLLGVLLLIGASDIRRYRVLNRALAVGITGLALVALGFGLADGMPLWWTLADAITATAFAVAVLWLHAGRTDG